VAEDVAVQGGAKQVALGEDDATPPKARRRWAWDFSVRWVGALRWKEKPAGRQRCSKALVTVLVVLLLLLSLFLLMLL
jgi:hypothetical protein